MNETDIRQLVPSIHAVHAVAVSPIVQLATSEPMKQSVSIYVPKPGHAVFGSVKMGINGKMGGKTENEGKERKREDETKREKENYRKREEREEEKEK